MKEKNKKLVKRLEKAKRNRVSNENNTQLGNRFIKVGKHLVGVAGMTLLFGGAVAIGTPMVTPTIHVSAATVSPGDGTVFGTLNGKTVYQAKTNDTGQTSFQNLVNAIVQDASATSTIVTNVGWQSNTTLENGKPLLQFGGAAWLGGDGYSDSDLAKGVLVQNGTAKIKNIGTAVQNGQTIPLDAGITIRDVTTSGGAEDSANVIMALRNMNGTLSLDFLQKTIGDNVGGGGGEGSLARSFVDPNQVYSWIYNTYYDVTLLNANTGQPLPSNTLFAMKVSDIDKQQLAQVTDANALAYVVAPNTNLSIQGSNFQTSQTVGSETDTTNLGPNAFIVFMQDNGTSVGFKYPIGIERNTLQSALFGKLNVKINPSGKIKVDKSTTQYGDNLPNNHYNFTNIKFDVINSSGTVVDTIDLDANGVGLSIDLPTGTYTLREKSSNWTSTGQTVRPDQTVDVTGGNTTNVNPNNTAVQGKITIRKTGKESGQDMWNDQYTLAGNKFKLTHEDGSVYNVTTDANGNAQIDKLPLGKYHIEETQASLGFANTFTPVDVTLTYKDNQTEVVFGNAAGTNQEVTGKISIKKTGKESGNSMWNDLYTLEGNKFKLTSYTDGKTYTATTDVNGDAFVDHLPLGKYKVEETQASIGFANTFQTQDVTISYKDQNTQVVFGNAAGTNQEVTGEITITKKGKESDDNMWNGNYTLAGNVFKLTSLTDGKTYEVTTNDKGVAKATHLPLGKYKVEEIKSSNGFANTFEPKEVEIKYKDQNTEVIFGETDGENQEIKGENLLKKSDEETGVNQNGAAVMKNAKYALFYADDATGSSPHHAGDPVKWTDKPNPELLQGEKVTSAVIGGTQTNFGDKVVVDVSDDKLEAAVGNLALGKYYWQEVDAGEGYVVDPAKHNFEITKKDDATENIITPDSTSKEQAIKAKIKFQKLVQVPSGSTLAGLNGVEITATPMAGTTAAPVIMTTHTNPATDEDGFGEGVLVYGDWKIEETKGVQGYEDIKPIYIHMETSTKKDILTISASYKEDFSTPFTTRTYNLTDDGNIDNPNLDGNQSGNVSSDIPTISLSPFTFVDGENPTVTPDPTDPSKDVTKTDGGDSIDNGEVALNSDFVYELNASVLPKGRTDMTTKWEIDDDYDQRYDRFDGTYNVYATTDFGSYKKGDKLPADFMTVSDNGDHAIFKTTQKFLDVMNANMNKKVGFTIHADFYRYNNSEEVVNTFVQTINDEQIKSNPVDTFTKAPEPHKFDLKKAQYDISGTSLLDDDGEMNDRYADSNANPYNDKTDNNESVNINTQEVKAGDKLVYQLWLDTKPFDDTSELQYLRMVDDYDEKALDVDAKKVKVYDKKGHDMTSHFKIEDVNGEIITSANEFTDVKNSKGETVSVVDTKKIPFAQDYKIDLNATVKKGLPDSYNIINTAKQMWQDSDGEAKEHITEKRVNVTPSAPKKEVVQTEGGESIDGGNVGLDSQFIYKLDSAIKHAGRTDDDVKWEFVDNFDEKFDKYLGTYNVYATTDFATFKTGDKLPPEYFEQAIDEKTQRVTFKATQAFLDVINANKDKQVGISIHADVYRFASSDEVLNTFTEITNDEKTESNEVDTKTPKVEPHKFDLSTPQFDGTVTN
ncbi:MAG: LPXTG cell wall anchor domain-containing protein [Streptococcaceae bacterium]|jgi:adhesin isopeptide-forming family sspB-C2 type protein|nr:LPXTG cell wall anchor domain-containing protein [Streptococcaceae bacterium]